MIQTSMVGYYTSNLIDKMDNKTPSDRARQVGQGDPARRWPRLLRLAFILAASLALWALLLLPLIWLFG